MDACQRTLVAEIVEILADGLRRNLETLREIFHHHPAEGAGDIENFSLAVGQTGHGAPFGKSALIVRPFRGQVNAAAR
jgi:hypothetical protein